MMATETRMTGIDVVGDMVAWVAHFCLFYETMGSAAARYVDGVPPSYLLRSASETDQSLYID